MVIHIITSLNIGGAEMMLKKIVSGRLNRGEKDVVICLIAEGKIGKDLQELGVTVYYLNIGSIGSMVKGIFKLNSILKSYPKCVIQTWLYHADLIGGVIGKLSDHKVIWNIRQTKFTSNNSFVTILIMRLCAMLSYFLPDKIVCAAESSMQSHINYGYNKHKFIVISNGFEPKPEVTEDEKLRMRAQIGLRSDDIIVGSVGRFHPDKDYITFIKAAQRVHNEKSNVKFVLVGKGLDQSNPVLTGWLKQYGLVDSFVLHGESRNVDLLLSIMNVFCLSSISEGFPNVVGEAMYNKTLCVVTNSGDSSKIVDNIGIVVQPRDAEAMAKGLLTMLNLAEDDRLKRQNEARKRIEDHYMISKTVESYSDLYKLISN